MQDKTCIKCTKIAVVIDRGFPLCGDCYCKQEQIGKYENKKQDITDNEQDNKLAS